jgi:hypothetical protein
MGLRFIREPSETPNISNADDAAMIRYAYGGENGYIKGRGAELSHTINGTIFRINSGVVVLQGYETEIDTNGWELNIGVIPTTQYFSVYYEVNLAAQTTSIKSVYDTTGYPTISTGDDLTTNRTGTARLLLYQLKTYNGVFQIVTKAVNAIKYVKDLRNELANGTLIVAFATSASSAIYANSASSATNVSTNINGKSISSIFESNGTTVKNATNAMYTTTPSQSENSTRIASTAFVKTAIQNFYGSGTLSNNLPSGTTSYTTSSVRRQGNFVLVEFKKYWTDKARWPAGTYTITVPQSVTTATGSTMACRPQTAVHFLMKWQNYSPGGQVHSWGDWEDNKTTTGTYWYSVSDLNTNGVITIQIGHEAVNRSGIEIKAFYEIT